jgi:ubiquinone biosynthesis monooxygenase Coq7
MHQAESLQDRLIAAFDQGLRTLTTPREASRPSPAHDLFEMPLTRAQRRRSAALMRVNHAGEMAAQALYSGQALVARAPATRRQLQTAADEERDHLAWCAERLQELGGHKSVLDPLWYAGSFCIGVLAGFNSDATSLGFVAETEEQVEAHLQDHLRRLPESDTKSQAILRRMSADEAHHGTMASLAGGVELPWVARRAMALGGGFLRQIALFL